MKNILKFLWGCFTYTLYGIIAIYALTFALGTLASWFVMYGWVAMFAVAVCGFVGQIVSNKL